MLPLISTSQPRKKGTATVDHHQVTYATVDSDATMQQEAKAAILPTGEYACVILRFIVPSLHKRTAA